MSELKSMRMELLRIIFGNCTVDTETAIKDARILEAYIHETWEDTNKPRVLAGSAGGGGPIVVVKAGIQIPPEDSAA